MFENYLSKDRRFEYPRVQGYLCTYFRVFTIDPVVAGVPDLFFQIDLVSQTMGASYPGKGS